MKKGTLMFRLPVLSTVLLLACCGFAAHAETPPATPPPPKPPVLTTPPPAKPVAPTPPPTPTTTPATPVPPVLSVPFLVFERRTRLGKNAGRVELCATRVTGTAEQMKWGDECIQIAVMYPLESRMIAAIPDGAGGIIVVYEDKPKDLVEIRAQRINRDGKLVYSTGKEPAPVIVAADANWSARRPLVMADGQGGALILFEKRPRAGNNTDLVIQHLGADGKLHFNSEAGFEVAATQDSERNAVLVPDGKGDVVVVWEAETLDKQPNIDIRATRLHFSPSKDRIDPHWDDAQKVIQVANTPDLERNPTAAADGEGGVVVCFEVANPNNLDNGPQRICAQRLSSTGDPLWKQKDVPYLTITDDTERNGNPRALAFNAPSKDNSGKRATRIFVIYEHTPVQGANAGNANLLAKIMVINDKPQPIPVDVACSKFSERNPVIVSPSQNGVSNGVVAIFEIHGLPDYYADEVDLGGQKITGDGYLNWGYGKERVNLADASEEQEMEPTVVSDNLGGVLVAYTAIDRIDKYATFGTINLQYCTISGNLPWGKTPKPVATMRGSENNDPKQNVFDDRHPLLITP